VVKTASQATLDKNSDPGLLESLKTVLKELIAEVASLEGQIKFGEVDEIICNLDRLLQAEFNIEEVQELEKLLQSFGFTATEDYHKGHLSRPSDARSSFTRSTISTPLFQETFLEQDDELSRSNKKTQSEIQLINYDISSKGMFWIEDTLHPKDRFFLEKVETH
jgi:hypothetical protein